MNQTEPRLELIHKGANATGTRVVLFDFDGTLSLVRSGWMGVMVPMMVDILAETKSGETTEHLREVVEDFVWRLTGKETVYQTIRLAEEVAKRGGKPKDPLEYKYQYLNLLSERIKDRIADLKGGCNPDKYLVPGSRALLEALRARGMTLYLASGTDEPYMKEEARLLDVERYFNGGVFGALDDLKAFSKGLLVRKIIDSAEFRGEQFLAFGDGYVEIEEVKQVGGFAVGAATNEPDCLTVDEWKRTRLIGVGADMIVPNYLNRTELLEALFPGEAH